MAFGRSHGKIVAVSRIRNRGASVHLREGAGRKKESSGRSPGSPLTARFNSMSTQEPFPIMPAVFKRVQMTGAVSSLIRSCMARLDTRTQQKVCIPCGSMSVSQMQVGQLEGW